MKKIIILIFIGFLSLASESQRLNQLETELLLEMKEIIKLEQKLNAPSFELSYRKLEVAFELFKKYQDEENRKFVSRGSYNDEPRELFFTKTREQAKLIEEVGNKAISRFNNKDQIYRVYYILGQVNTDLNQTDKAKDYLAQGLEKTPNNEEALKEKHSNMAIYADILFNDKRFSKAARLYEVLIQKKDHFAINKFKYNYAFCLYNLGQFDKALNYIRQVAQSEANDKYDLSLEATNQSYIFFEGARRFNEGIEFYKTNKPVLLWDFTKHLLVKGFHLEGIKSFNALLSETSSDLVKRIDYQIKFLKIILDNGKYQTFRNVLPMMSNSFSQGDETLKEQIKIFFTNTLADLQTKYKSSEGVKTAKIFKEMNVLAREIILFLIKEDKSNVGDHYYLLGDYYYELKLYNKSFLAYEKSFENRDKANGDLKTGRPQIDSMVALYSSKKVSSTIEKRKRVYFARVKLHPLDKKNLPLLKEIFEINITLRQFSGAEDVLFSMKNVYNLSSKLIVANALRLFNIYIESRNEERMLSLLSELKKNNVNLPIVPLKKITNTVDQIEFDDAVTLLNQGEYEQAYKKFSNVEKKTSNKKLKKDSRYNIAVTFYRLGKLTEAFDKMLSWSKTYGFDDVVFFNNILKNFATKYDYKNQYIKAEKLFTSICSLRMADKRAYLSMIINYELGFIGKKKSFDSLLKYKKCVSKDVVDANILTILEDISFSELKTLDTYWAFINTYRRSRETVRAFIKSTFIISWQKYDVEKLDKLVAMVASKDSGFQVVVTANQNARGMINRLRSFKVENFSFPPQKYKSQVFKTLEELGKMDKSLAMILKFNSPFEYKSAMSLAIRNYSSVIREILSFNPKIDNPETKKGFKRSTDELVRGLIEKRESLLIDYRKIARNNDYMSLRNGELYNISYSPYFTYPLSRENRK